MTDLSAQPLAALGGPVRCRRTANALIMTGHPGDAPETLLILTFIGPNLPELPHSLPAAEVLAAAEHHYRIIADERCWDLEATSAHVHRDIGRAFYRAIPPRAAPLGKRLFWRVVLALAGTRAGKRLLSSLRGSR